MYARQLPLGAQAGLASTDPFQAGPPEDPLQAWSASDDELPALVMPGYRVLWASAEEKAKAKRRKTDARRVREHRARGSSSD